MKNLDCSQPIFCFASDMDWNHDVCVRDALDIYKKYHVKLNVFATHKTEVFSDYDNLQIGVHPNFLPGSTHGDSIPKVIDHVFDLFPEAETYRSHSYYDSQVMTEIMSKRGIKYDANFCAYLQDNLQPLQHCHGSIRFPSFFDDNIHWAHEGSWDFEALRAHFFTPGLKIINLHPYPIALNIPNSAYYQANSDVFNDITKEQLLERRYNGAGPRSFLIQLLEEIADNYPTYHFRELYEIFSQKSSPRKEVQGRPQVTGNYEQANDEERKKMVQDQYNKMDNSNVYITSRDYNLRELEISALKNHVKEGKILDCGCGNGYTLLSLAKELKKSQMTGVDFSENLIRGAKHLKQEMADDLSSIPDFICQEMEAFLEESDETFDSIITERFIVNLPSVDAQYAMIKKLCSRLNPQGKLILVEGSQEGFLNLNAIREKATLPTIPDVYPGNESSKKLNSKKFKEEVAKLPGIELCNEQDFSFYSIASKVFHPLFVKPMNPQFASKINDMAALTQRSLDTREQSCQNIGACHIWVLQRNA